MASLAQEFSCSKYCTVFFHHAEVTDHVFDKCQRGSKTQKSRECLIKVENEVFAFKQPYPGKGLLIGDKSKVLCY